MPSDNWNFWVEMYFFNIFFFCEGGSPKNYSFFMDIENAKK